MATIQGLPGDLIGAFEDLARHLAGGFIYVLRHPTQRSFVGWLLLFVVIVVAITLRERRKAGRERDTSLLSQAFPREYYFHRSSVQDAKFFVVDKAFEFLFLGSILLSAPWIAGHVASWMRSAFDISDPPLGTSTITLLLFALVSLIAYDAGYSFSHMLTHRVPFLWEFHKVHHSAEVLTPLTNFREHPVDKLLAALCFAPIVGLVDGTFLALTGPDSEFVTIFGVSAVFFAYYFLVSFRHSNVWIAYGPIVGRVLSSPAQHQIHHGRADEHIDTNYAQIFSFLDAAMGSLYIPTEREEVEFGLTTPDVDLTTNVRGFYWKPFRNAWRVLRAGGGLWRVRHVPQSRLVVSDASHVA